jgi:hypothetical protein
MANYRLPELDLSTRTALMLEVLKPIPERRWGRVTELARIYGVSRGWLYELRDQALNALQQVLTPHKPGPKHKGGVVEINDSFLQRIITTLPMLTPSVRGIQLGLKLLLGVDRSVGYISQTLKGSGVVAEAYNRGLTIPLPVLGEADEIFQGRHPCLTVVDGKSFLVLHLSPAEIRDGTAWGITFLDLQERGVQFHDLVSDEAKGIQAGAKEAKLAIPLRPDLFHLLREAHRISGRLERAAYRAIKMAERARRAEREANAPKRRRGGPLKVTCPLVEAEAQQREAISTYDLWLWLIGEVRQALEPITPQGRLTAVAEARKTVRTAAELLMALNRRDVRAFAQKLLDRLEALVNPLAWLEQSLKAWREGLDLATETLIVWAWQNRHTLSLEAGEGFQPSLRPLVQAFWDVLEMFHRSSSLAEALHSWLRPHLLIHRGMPNWLLPLLQLFWNHRPFQRGKRAGNSPLGMAGVTDVPSLKEVLDRLFSPKPTAQAAA